ncbi:MAG TPA: hypothetical protein VFI34_03345 [Candidatus Limnocylindrales bacterium]|nr:hypothetical protein [Candidatus Limnocylindrales bacterium]
MNAMPGAHADTGPSFGGDQPSLTIEGLEDSALKLTLAGLVVCQPASVGSDVDRFWAYADLRDLTVANYGPIGVIRAIVRSSDTELPLLLLEPDQIVAARRTLEVVWSRFAERASGRSAA